MSKIKEEELQELRQSVDTLNSIQMQIGGLEAQKHELLHAVAEANQKFSEIQKSLEENYGKVSVNIQTGEITKTDEPDKKD